MNFELIDKQVCMQLFQFFGMFISVTGIFVVFRITSIEHQIRDTLEILKNALIKYKYTNIAYLTYRERIEKTIFKMKEKSISCVSLKTSPYSVDSTEWYEIREPMDDFFKMKYSELQIIFLFTVLLSICWLTIIILFFCFYPLKSYGGWLYINFFHIIFFYLISSFFLFIGYILLSKSNFLKWEKNKEEWKEIRDIINHAV